MADNPNTAVADEVTTIVIVSGTRGDSRTATVLAEPTATPGLFVTPDVRGGRMTGYWQVTHGPSGLCVPLDELGGVDLHTARRVADALAEVPVDWTDDRDTLSAAFTDKDTRLAVLAAVKKGKYPPSDGRWNGDGSKPVDGPGGWPNAAEQATAKQLAGAYTASALQRSVDMWQLVKYDQGDKTAQRAFVQNAAAMIGEYGVVFLLRVLAGIDQEAADAAALDLWEACETGDSFGEWLSEWAREYGIPTPEQSSETPGLVPSPAPAADRG